MRLPQPRQHRRKGPGCISEVFARRILSAGFRVQPDTLYVDLRTEAL